VSQLTYRTRWQGREYGNTHQAIPYTNAPATRTSSWATRSSREAWDPRIRGSSRAATSTWWTRATSPIPRIVGPLRGAERGRAQHVGGRRPAVRRLLQRGAARPRHLRRAGGRPARAGARDRGAQRPSTTTRSDGPPFTWSPRLHNGLVFASDFNSGLWVTRLVEDGGRPFGHEEGMSDLNREASSAERRRLSGLAAVLGGRATSAAGAARRPRVRRLRGERVRRPGRAGGVRPGRRARRARALRSAPGRTRWTARTASPCRRTGATTT
jgi:hypothetical protein